jgi:hypothetical protein
MDHNREKWPSKLMGAKHPIYIKNETVIQRKVKNPNPFWNQR